MITAERMQEIRHIAPTAGPLGQEAINELMTEVEQLRGALHLAMSTLTHTLDECHRLSGLPDDVNDYDAILDCIRALVNRGRNA